MNYTVSVGTPINLTASGIVSKAPGSLLGFFCNSTSTGTVVLRSGSTASSATISGTITPTAGTFYPYPAACPNGLFATIANTLDVTFFFAAS